jgi:hypothetical protein
MRTHNLLPNIHNLLTMSWLLPPHTLRGNSEGCLCRKFLLSICLPSKTFVAWPLLRATCTQPIACTHARHVEQTIGCKRATQPTVGCSTDKVDKLEKHADQWQGGGVMADKAGAVLPAGLHLLLRQADDCLVFPVASTCRVMICSSRSFKRAVRAIMMSRCFSSSCLYLKGSRRK